MQYGTAHKPCRLSAAAAWSTAALLTLSACGPDQEGEPAPATDQDQATPTTPEPTDTADEATETPESDDDATGTGTGTEEPTADATDTAADPEPELPIGGTDRVDDAELPGESAATYFSREGEAVGVVGSPGPLPVLAVPTVEGEMDEMVGEVFATDTVLLGGRERYVPESEQSWIEIELAEGYGWVQAGHFYYFGEHEDITDQYADQVSASADPEELALQVAELHTADWGEEGQAEGGPAVEIVNNPDFVDVDYYIVDATGMMDDSVAGDRLFVTVEESDAGYELSQVERTVLCMRGVSDDALCV